MSGSIERTIHLDAELDLPADELWRLIGTAEGWSEWLVDQADLVVSEGAVGDVVDDAVRRTVRIESVRLGECVSFVWTADDGDASTVTLTIDETAPEGRVLRITEVPVAACAACPYRLAVHESRWDLRECLLCLAACATSRV